MKIKILKRSLVNTLLITGFFLFISQTLFSQIGISVSPPRLYYELKPGEMGSQKVLVSNISESHQMSLAITFGDWMYDDYGNNVMLPPDSLNISCASWLSIAEGTYLTLEPGENREIELSMEVPDETRENNVSTAMLYVTQMNAVDGVDADGAAIKVNVRQGIKIYHSAGDAINKKIEIVALSFNSERNGLILGFNNSGNIWANGTVKTSLFNQSTGNELMLDENIFYTLPGDNRTMFIPFGSSLDKGEYTATVIIDYGKEAALEAAELQFSYE